MTENIESKLSRVPFRITNPELIPAERYYDEAFFEAEKKHLWPHAWQMACRLEEIPEVGDYTVYDILDKSVIMIHTKDGVKGFLNACRHRGVKLAHGPGHCGTEGFVCPFHGWRWNADGENTFIYGKQIFSPEIIDKAQIDLAPVRTEYWAGAAFINFDENAPSLRESLGPVADRIDARAAEKLRVDWWFGTVIPCNWKLAMEAFHESYHVMQTHRQLFDKSPNATLQYGRNYDNVPVHENETGSKLANQIIDANINISEGMGGSLVHTSEVAVLEKLRDIVVPENPAEVFTAFSKRVAAEIEADGRARGAPTFDILAANENLSNVEFVFPNFFLLPMFGAMASYRMRPITAETCMMEIWNLALLPDDGTHESPTEPTILPYDSQDFPEIPRQDYSNLPLQQIGLHNLDFMRIAKGTGKNDAEGLISNYQRVLDGFLAKLDAKILVRAQNVSNSGFEVGILDIGY
ncbi:MAG: hypothetical protein RLZZ136_203 [Pseudomonadota bacterium]|jgi:phenylpropionate dioxygenase-like ring-hydroxylating dioxygenase large terminal subunit